MRSMSVAGSDPVIRRCLINVRFAPQADLSTITDGGCRKSPAPRRAVLVGDRAEAVVLDLVQPLFRWRAALTPFSAPVPYDVIDTAGRSRPRKCRGAGGGGHALTGTRRDTTAALILGLLAAALLAQNADAQTKPDRWSANYLMPACRNWITFAGDRQGIDEALCAGIISGLAYTVKFLPPDSSSCTPQGVTTGEMVRVVVAYIERRPERMHEDFRRLAIEAWHEAWPCM